MANPTYVGSSSSFGYKKVVFLTSGSDLQLKASDSGCTFVIDADVAADAAVVYLLPKASETNVGCTFRFVLDASPDNVIDVDRHADDSDNIFGCVNSAEAGGEGATSDGTAQETVRFAAAAVKGDSFELTLLGNGTDKWWQLSGDASDADHIAVAAS
tara:strand:+ start:1644 stop:2114 length:471 start_codon:yes stop_codon:yes gene_type:complete